MIGQFVGAWALYWLLLTVLPLRVIYGSGASALAIQAGFVVLVIVSYVACLSVLPGREADRSGDAEMPARDARQVSLGLVIGGIALSAFGLAFLVVDKILIQDIDFTQGLAAARAQWTEQGALRGGVSSPFSVLGYLVGSAYFVSMALVLSPQSRVSLFGRLTVVAAACLLALANSALTGGRSTLLLLIAFIAVSVPWARLRFPSSRRSWLVGIACAVLTVSVTSYVLLISIERAATFSSDMDAYLVSTAPFLGLSLETWYAGTLDGSVLSVVGASIVLAGAYLVHSFATTAAMADAAQGDGPVVFFFSIEILSRLGIVDRTPGEWLMMGRFPSLPGALWYEARLLGLVAGAVGAGVAGAVADAWLRRMPSSLLVLGVQRCWAVVLLLSPLLFAGDVLAFPFIAAAFLQLWLLSQLLNMLSRHCLLLRR